MRKNLKRNLTVAVVATMMTVPMLGAVNVHAAHIVENQDSEGVNKLLHNSKTGDSWSVAPLGGTKEHPINTTKTFSKNGHTFIVESNGNTPGTIIGMDGNKGASNSQVMAALEGRLGSASGESSTSSTSRQTSQFSTSSKPEYQNSNTNHGKLVQTGEHSTAKKAGIAAVVIALAAFVAFKVRKVARRN